MRMCLSDRSRYDCAFAYAALAACLVVPKALAQKAPAPAEAQGAGDQSGSQPVNVNCLMISSDGKTFATIPYNVPRFSTDPETYSPTLGSAESVVKATMSSDESSLPLAVNCPVEMVPPAMPASTPATVASPDYVLFHVVNWGLKGQAVIKESKYYLYDRRSGLHKKPHLTNDLRIYGSGNVAFVTLHFGIDNSCGIQYSIEAKSETAVPVAELQALLQYAAKTFGITLPAPGGGKRAPAAPYAVGVYGAAMLNGLKKLPASIDVSGNLKSTPSAHVASDDSIVWGPNISVGCPAKKPVSQVIENSKVQSANSDSAPSGAAVAANGIESGAAAAPSNGSHSDQSSTSSPATQSEDSTKPADGSANNSGSKQSPEFSQTIDDEGLYHWDVGLAIPVTGRTIATYSSQSGVVSRAVNKREDLYAMFHYFPWAVDLKGKNKFMLPSFMAGIPVANRPFNYPVVGVSPFGFNLFGLRGMPWAAALFQREFRPGTLSVGSSATSAALNSDLRPKRTTKYMVGITFSVKDAQSLWQKKSSNSTQKTGSQQSKSSSGGNTSDGS